MSKFVDSKESVLSNLMLWAHLTTQDGAKEKYDTTVWPANGDYNNGPINFNIPEQAKSFLDDIVIVTKFRLKSNDLILTERKEVFLL